MLNTGTASTFQQYFDTVFSSYITTQLQTAQRVDVVFDTYIGFYYSHANERIGKTSYRLMKTKLIFVPGGYSSPN